MPDTTLELPSTVARLTATLLLAYDLNEAAEYFPEVQRPCIFISENLALPGEAPEREWYVRAPKATFKPGDLVAVQRLNNSPQIVELARSVRVRRVYETFAFNNV